MKKVFLAIFLLLLPTQELFAATGAEACQLVKGEVLKHGIVSSCEYKRLDSGAWMYAVRVLATSKYSGEMTIGLIVAAIAGVDTTVPTKTAGIGIAVEDAAMILMMDEVRLCMRDHLDNDKTFLLCILSIAQYGGL